MQALALLRRALGPGVLARPPSPSGAPCGAQRGPPGKRGSCPRRPRSSGTSAKATFPGAAQALGGPPGDQGPPGGRLRTGTAAGTRCLSGHPDELHSQRPELAGPHRAAPAALSPQHRAPAGPSTPTWNQLVGNVAVVGAGAINTFYEELWPVMSHPCPLPTSGLRGSLAPCRSVVSVFIGSGRFSPPLWREALALVERVVLSLDRALFP